MDREEDHKEEDQVDSKVDLREALEADHKEVSREDLKDKGISVIREGEPHSKKDDVG